MTKLYWLEADRKGGGRTLTHRRLDWSGTRLPRIDRTGQAEARLLHTGWTVTGQTEARAFTYTQA